MVRSGCSAANVVPKLADAEKPLTGEVRPAWLSEPVLVVPADVAADAGEEGAGQAEDTVVTADALADAPRAALYAVCLEPDDPRCDR